MKRILMQRIFFVSILALTASIYAPFGAIAQVRWLADETVRTSAGGATEVKMGFNNTSIVAAVGGVRYITWARGDSLFLASSQNGTAWGAATLILRGSGSMNLPTLAATSDGKLCIGWSDPAGIKAVTSSDGGKTWTTTQALATRGSGLCLAAGQNGALYTLWHSGSDDTPSDMMFATWQNGVWAAARAIDAASATNAALWGSLCVVGNSIYAVWRENTTGQFRVYLTRSKNGGATWDTPRNVITEDRSGDPSVAESGGQLVVAYQRAQQIYTAISTDDGATFNTAKLVGSGLFARIVSNENGFFALVWERFIGDAKNDQAKQVGFVYSADYGYTYSRDSTLSGTGSKLVLVQFTGANEITASWFNTNNGGAVVAKRAILTGGGVGVKNNEISALHIAPNPVSYQVVVQLTLSKAERVRCRLYNTLGAEVVQILDADIAAGVHTLPLSLPATFLPNGSYFVRLETATSLATKPLLLMR